MSFAGYISNKMELPFYAEFVTGAMTRSSSKNKNKSVKNIQSTTKFAINLH
jgi:hypothetical protein